MKADEETTPTARAAELLERGPGRAARRRQPLRGLARRIMLRAMRPFSYHERMLDAEIVAALRRHEGAFQRQEAVLEKLAERTDERLERLEHLARELIFTADALREAISGAEAHTHEAVASIASLASELNALPFIEGDLLKRLDSPMGGVIGFRASEWTREEGDYLAFEELFRGTGDRVLELQRPYLQLLREHQPVLDVGCGRGELLSLLAQEGVQASGVDSDRAMVERCRELGLAVSLGDANEHLEQLEDESLGTVFSAQVIEHLSYEQLRRMLALARRKLSPGGLLIAETVNPHRISSMKTFWVDLTHQHPVFPEVALALCAIAGYESGYVFAPGYDDFERARFESPAYAVVATTPLGNGDSPATRRQRGSDQRAGPQPPS
jgi:SAM-dependent methyltransferase